MVALPLLVYFIEDLEVKVGFKIYKEILRTENWNFNRKVVFFTVVAEVA